MRANRPRSRDKPFAAKEKCRGRDSNPHGTFAPEDFKSFDYSEKVFGLLALFRSNVKVCKFMCKCSKKLNNIGHLQLCRSEGFSRIRNFRLFFGVFFGAVFAAFLSYSGQNGRGRLLKIFIPVEPRTAVDSAHAESVPDPSSISPWLGYPHK
jgi:hypothetical protein